jgi:hypothetical protein
VLFFIVTIQARAKIAANVQKKVRIFTFLCQSYAGLLARETKERQLNAERL